MSLRWGGERLLQRLSSLRQSVRQRARKPPSQKFPPPPESNPDSDRVFFRGFSGVSAQPTAPPRRKKSSSKLSRSLSLSSSRDLNPGRGGGGGLTRIEELYPDCPRTPIYAVVDLSKKRKRESNLPDLVTRVPPPDTTLTDLTLGLTTEEKTNKMVKSHSANNSPTYVSRELLLDNEIAPAKTKVHHKKRKHKKKREEAEDDGEAFIGQRGKRPGM